MAAPKKSKTPEKKPLAPRTSTRPPKKPKMIGASPSGGTRGIDPKDNYGSKPKKMAGGGKCRGMGAASRGGNYKMG